MHSSSLLSGLRKSIESHSRILQFALMVNLDRSIPVSARINISVCSFSEKCLISLIKLFASPSHINRQVTGLTSYTLFRMVPVIRIEILIEFSSNKSQIAPFNGQATYLKVYCLFGIIRNKQTSGN